MIIILNIMENEEKVMKCKECGGRLIVSDYGELVCSECGLVHEKIYLQPLFEIEPLSDFSAVEKLYVNPDGKPLRKEDLGSTFIHINGKLKDNRGKEINKQRFFRLKRVNTIYVKKHDRSIDAVMTLLRVCSLLNIPKSVYERAGYICNKILSGKRRVGTTYQLAAASLIIASREHKYPLTLKDVIRIFRELGHKVSAKSIMRITSEILNELSIKTIAIEPKDYMTRIMNILKSNIEINRRVIYFTGRRVEEYYNRLMNYSLSIYERIDEKFRIGKNPYLLAVSIVYIADKLVCKELNCQPILSQKLVSEVLGSTQYTLRQHMKYLNKVVKIEGNYDTN